MLAEIEVAFKDLIACLQTAKMYGVAHPSFDKSLDKAYASFENVFATRSEMVIGIIGEELAFEKEILFDLSKLLKPAIIYLKERNIERLGFSSGLSRQDLKKFVEFIAKPKEDFKTDVQELLIAFGVEHINVGKLKTALGQGGNFFGSRNQSNLYDDSKDKVNQALSGVLNLESIDYHGLKFSLNSIIDSLGTQHQELLSLATVKKYDLEIYVHMLNVSIFAMYFSSRLGFQRSDVLNIGLAALFHDIGKLYISRKLLHKPDRLSESEFERMTSHTILGACLMLKYIDGLGIFPVVISFEHHLKYDMSGYPRLRQLKKQHLVSAIVSLCDVYDALSQRRGYKQDYSPDVVYNIMMKGSGTAFDPELLDKFFKIMGYWPIGAVVELNDSTIALVRSQNEFDIMRPKIEIVSPEEKKRLVDLTQEKSLSIQRYLNPWKEGKDFLSKRD